MASVLLCSELSYGASSLSRLADCAVELIAQGHAVNLLCPNITRAHLMPEFAKAAIFPAPHFSLAASLDAADETDSSNPSTFYNYSSVLLARGYGDSDILESLLRSWLHFLATLDADCVIAEDAPTALLAAKLLNVPSIRIGHGFSIPPQTVPLASLCPWKESSEGSMKIEEYCYSDDQRLLDVVNHTIKNLAFKNTQFNEARELFSHAAQWLVSWPELDHYGARDLPYVAQWNRSNEVASEPKWPGGSDTRVFIEMSLKTPHITVLLSQLTALGESVLAVIPDASDTFIKQYQTDYLRIQRTRVSIDAVAKQCDTIISDGSYELTYRLLSQGVPSILLPSSPQSALLAYRLAKQKLCYAGPAMPSKLNTISLLEFARKHGAEWDNAAQLASRYSKRNNGEGDLVRLRDLITAKFRKA